jgi:hypothetical protein
MRTFIEELDRVIAKNRNQRWIIGWGLTKPKKPYKLMWVDGKFKAKRISVAEATKEGTGEMGISHLLDPDIKAIKIGDHEIPLR